MVDEFSQFARFPAAQPARNDLNEVVGVDIVLQVGGATETVEVTGAAPLVDTTSTQLGAVVGERAVSQLPLAQRDAYQLLQLQPGAQSFLPSA